jgi:hypothetical protein
MSKRSEMQQRYEEDRLYCPACKEQPEYFHEVMSWQVNRVMPDGTFIEMKNAEVMEYQCPECESTACWGWELNRGHC